MANDEAVQATNDDASLGKRFAVHQGYWKDPYIQYFVKNIERKPPDMNRGYYARTLAILRSVTDFVKRNQRTCQVVNLGAGFDTIYWKLKDADLQPANYIEVDFKNVTSRKCYYIGRHRKQLLEKICEDTSQIKIENSELYSPQYKIMNADLRNISALEEALTNKAGLQYELPTLFVTECVLVYLEPGHSRRLIEWAARSFPTAAFLNYEPVNMSDRFGQVMVENLKKRQCELLGVEHCTSIESQRARFSECGWNTAVHVETMWSVYHSFTSAERVRIEKLEFLDEVELFEQLMQHYCLCLALNDAAGTTGLAEMQLF